MKHIFFIRFLHKVFILTDLLNFYEISVQVAHILLDWYWKQY